MKACSCGELYGLNKKVKQHERTISQLIEIISVTNGRLTDLTNKLNQYHQIDRQKISHT